MKRDITNTGLIGMAKVEDAARLLSALANAKRLLALCHLLQGEKSVGQLAELVGLSPTALSQHLGRMRGLGLVATRREGRAIFYRLASPDVAAILETLYRLYCAPAPCGADTSWSVSSPGPARLSRASSASRL